MDEQQIEIQAELNYPSGIKTVKMTLKQPSEIEDCAEEKAVILHLVNNETFIGIFKGMDENDVMLGTLSGKSTIGLKKYWIDHFFEEI